MPFSRILFLMLCVICIVIFVRYCAPSDMPFSRQPLLEQLKEEAPAKGLHPAVEEKKNRLIEQTLAIGIPILITDGYRSVEEQDRIYAKGRTAPGNIVTHAKGGESLHNYGLAIDFALKIPDGNVVWDLERDGNQNGTSDWMEVVAIAKGLGFEWGGDWPQFKDYPHFQFIPDDIR
ncbi:M15 family metallopeptidase [Aureibacillus halotolerans]|uniref:Peptidoglycan L-alanyl-D-glutamate endopeptidase CwlK n=1 Tax=Aureibacillus halotolerans TaxID=1508390 RepID=A0A4R6TVJ0_9BACI|nr:M15 family metallopeptidase [Aureibacillus halotolerans]TDQ36263.1 peptidoglycan L-alanyl-D-glutamate endopeptidase CwlK [Aureibacillus halotolerans]